MFEKNSKTLPILLCVLIALTACSPKTGILSTTSVPVNTVIAVEPTAAPTPIPATATPVPKVLSICMGQEPSSLFLYGDSSQAARNIRQAIYDGPFDLYGYDFQPVLLKKNPSQEIGDVKLEPVQVKPGDLLIDNDGKWMSLGEGVNYRPSGCTSSSCAKSYSGTDPVQMDSLVVRFQLITGIQWSDKTPLTADDSVYSYEIAKALFPAYRPDLMNVTQSYQALDSETVEWRGIPGYQSGPYASLFFSPLPRHAWGQMKPEELPSAQIASKTPLGWGPYIIDEWSQGSYISLRKNPNYFRSSEGLPRFDQLVFRFEPDAGSALEAIKSGKCDLVDETAHLQPGLPPLAELKSSGGISLTVQTGAGWEVAAFGILPIDPKRPSFFTVKETRQAVAQCIDRQKILGKIGDGQLQAPDSYVSPADPLYNSHVVHYSFDPQRASGLLNSIGWLDTDNDPATPRVAQGVPGVPDGTPFKFVYQVPKDSLREEVARIVAQSLVQCGIQADLEIKNWDELMAPGPEGIIFGRQFDMAQFGWMSSIGPSCMLFVTGEIPGPYPDFQKGWGGANAMGYSNPGFDQACKAVMASLPDTEDYKNALQQVQQIFAEELPVIPLYFYTNLLASRPDLCGLKLDSSVTSSLWNLENFDYGEGCSH